MTDPPDLPSDTHEIQVDMEAFNEQMTKIYGPRPQMNMPQLPSVDLDACMADADAALQSDADAIVQTAEQLMKDLDDIEVERLQADLFKLPPSHLDDALSANEAVARGRRYVDLVVKSIPAAEEQFRNYVDAVAVARTEREASYAAAFAVQAEQMIIDVTAARSRLNVLEQERAALEEERQEALDDKRSFEISSALFRLETEELSLKTQIGFSEHATDNRDAVQAIADTNAAFADFSKLMWTNSARMVRAVQGRLQQQLARRRRWRSGILAVYAIVVVVAAVMLDKVLEEVPAAVLVSLAAASLLALLDKRVIAPRLEHHTRCQVRKYLKAEIAVCAQALVRLRQLQAQVDAMAAYADVPKVQVLSRALMAPPSRTS